MLTQRFYRVLLGLAPAVQHGVHPPGGSVPTRSIMIKEARSEADEQDDGGQNMAAGAGPRTSQMKAAAANASTMLPSSHCSAERQISSSGHAS